MSPQSCHLLGLLRQLELGRERQSLRFAGILHQKRPLPLAVDALRSERGEVAVELELGDLACVGVPLRTFVADEPLEDVLA